MSKKNRRNRGKQRSKASPSEAIRRALDKGNAKQALKDAKLCVRSDPSNEHRQLLQEAYISRAEQLHKGGFPDQATNLLQDLESGGVTDQEIQLRVQRLRVLLGGSAGGCQSGTTEVPPEMLNELADQAVLHVQRRSAAYGQLNEQADRVLAALKAVEEGDDQAAASQLKDIARTSPFADWRLLVRGLSSHYAGDRQRARSNWERLDPERAPHRIAQTLLAASGQLPAEQTSAMDASVRRLKYAVAQDSTTLQMEQLTNQYRAGDWRGLLRSLRTFRQRFAKSHAVLLEKLTDTLWKRFVRDGDQRLLWQLINAAPGPALDPKWNRARAMMAQEIDKVMDLNTVEEYWQAYAMDVQQATCLSEEDRKIAGALVLERLSTEFAHAAVAEMRPSSPIPFFSSPPDTQYVRLLQKEAIKNLRAAIRLCPRLRSAHEGIIRLHLLTDDNASAAKAYQDQLKQFPDDYDTLQWLSNYYLEEDQPEAAQPYTEAAVRLRPRDPDTETLAWHQRLAMIRHWTRKRKFDKAKQELDDAAVHQPKDIPPYSIEVLRATVAYKAKDAEAAERHLAAAKATLQEPTTIWMVLHANAARYSLPADIKKKFNLLLKKDVEAKCTSQTAGGMARFLFPFVSKNIKYTGMATHRRILLAYLNRCKRVRWELADLKDVCLFMSTVEEWKQYELRKELMGKGLRLFPTEPIFPYLLAQAEVAEGPFTMSPFRVRHLLELAMEAAEAGETTMPPRMRENIKRMLAMTDAAGDMFSSVASTLADLCDLDDDDDEDDDDDFFDDQWDDDDDDDLEEGPVSTSTSTGSGQRRRKKESTDGQQYFPF